MWEEAEQTWLDSGVVEFGIHQIDVKAGTPKWRRHKGGPRFRFATVWNALFSDKGARSACVGTSSYPKATYAAGTQLFVPYVATWLQGEPRAFLVRPSAGDPEITLVPVASIEAVRSTSDQELLTTLAHLFAEGAAESGVRWLKQDRIARP